jgi:hypothetical protein
MKDVQVDQSNKGLTCATFHWSGKMDVSIDLKIKDVIGPVTTGFARLIIFAEIPSKPVAFFYTIYLWPPY